MILTIAAVVSAGPLVQIFTHDPETFALADAGFPLFAVNFLFSGINIASSGFFTALSNGKVSAIISFCRTLVFIAISLVILPHFLGILGVELSQAVADAITIAVAIPLQLKIMREMK